MFTGIVTDVGTVVAIERPGDTRFTIRTSYDMSSVALGASIACSGVCLTVIHKQMDRFTVSASAETVSKTTLGEWRVGTAVNLERALRLGDELGGHLVTGHVDGVARITTIRAEGESRRFVVEVPAALAPFIAPKGSVTLNGVSLTVNEVAGTSFGVNLIPHTLQVTNFDAARPGDGVNLEVDLLARYVARLLGQG